MIDKLKEISKDQLLAEVKKYADSKAKFVTGSCNDLGDKLEVTYYFNASPGMDMSALRFVVGKGEEVPSMTGIYLTAVLIENEMKELFGPHDAGAGQPCAADVEVRGSEGCRAEGGQINGTAYDNAIWPATPGAPGTDPVEVDAGGREGRRRPAGYRLRTPGH